MVKCLIVFNNICTSRYVLNIIINKLNDVIILRSLPLLMNYNLFPDVIRRHLGVSCIRENGQEYEE